ncbi:MAG TPA: glycoside hydrolase family 2 TIM barrel-domain containing protein [Armatimonadota bacterium]|nr:glycoside hydrolase family 2 TIM barrel-domain containing protein [Armatimonadota bacterium]
MRRFLILMLLLAVPAFGRETINLSGQWDFKTDPKEVGVSQLWFNAKVPFDRKIVVPGAWNAQGVGEPTDKLFSGYPGLAWYRKTVTIPSNWQGKVTWLKFGGVHRYADVWVNGRHLGEHIGYLTPFKYDISSAVKPGQKAVIAVRVDGRQRKDIDPLIGCFDIIDAMNVTWGGIYREIVLEATDHTWIEDVYVIPHLASQTAEIKVEIGGKPGARAVADVFDANSRIVASGLTARIKDLKTWSPSSPYLYTAKVRLILGNRQIDEVKVRFGMREIAVKDGQFLLNGKPIFLRGYGDDCIYPNTVCPPADKAEYYRRFKIARDYGFNYVRHHSWFPLAEYFDVADELGIMLQPEFPIAYASFYQAATPEGKRLYLDQWRDIIKANRNHPSIITWSMSNEEWGGFDLAPEMYDAAKKVDSTRLVIDSDGIPIPEGKSRGTLDFLTPQFDEGGKFGFNDGKYELGRKPDKPVVVHEMANFGTLPSLAQLPKFQGGIIPFWLVKYQDLVKEKGVGDHLGRWVDNSQRLQAAVLKTNIEAARMSDGIKGYDQWLLQDYWTGSNGVLDFFYDQKGLKAEDFRRFNSPTVLLIDCPRRNLRSGESVPISLVASRYEDKPSKNATLAWKLRGKKVYRTGIRTGLNVPSGGNTKLVGFDLHMPFLKAPEKLTLTARLDGLFSNSWDFWVFPQVKTVSPEGLLVVRKWNNDALDHLNRGGRVILLSADGVFPTVPSVFKPCWWLGDPQGDSNVGTDIADHPAMKGFPHEGWCDLQFVNLLNGSKAVLLDDLPVKIEPIVRCLDVHTTLRNKAYLFEANVGKGRLLVSSMNLSTNDPAAEYLLDQLIRYANSSDFNPRVTLPAEYLQSANR